MQITRWLSLPVLALAASGCADSSTSGSSDELADQLARAGTSRLYTSSNAASGNQVLAFNRARNGQLTAAGATATGGTGTDAGLGSQGALALSADGRVLIVVNAGSNDVTSFSVSRGGLAFASRVPSGGTEPISVAISGNLVYVLNAGGTGNVTGLTLDRDDRLHALSGASYGLSGADVGPAEVAFSPYGDALVVTEKKTNAIDTFTVEDSGRLRGLVTTPSAGQTPFGFAFTDRGQLIVSEAFGGAAGAGTVSSYALADDSGGASVITGALADDQGAPCWIALTPDDAYAYTTNTASGTISGYTVDRHGRLALLDDGGVTATTGEGTKPADEAIDIASRFVYVVNGGTGTLVDFAIGDDGALSATGASASVPTSAAGLIAL